ncbi:hypothetical protein C0J52_08636 [Blattella germanica]|nr:hypothetical protein C0J52_08636 [Blattella germanica]
MLSNNLTSSIIFCLICLLMEMKMIGCDQILSPNDDTESNTNETENLTGHLRKTRFINHHVHHMIPHHPPGALQYGHGYGGLHHGALHHGVGYPHGYGPYHGHHGYHGLHARQAEDNQNNNKFFCNKVNPKSEPWNLLLSESIPLNPNLLFNPAANFQATRINYNTNPAMAGYQGMGVNFVGNQAQTNAMEIPPLPVISVQAPIPGYISNGDSNIKSLWAMFPSIANKPGISTAYGTTSIPSSQLNLMEYGPGIVIGTKEIIGNTNNGNYWPNNALIPGSYNGLNNALVPGSYNDRSIISNDISQYNDLNGKYNIYYGNQRHHANGSISQERTTMQDMSSSYNINKEDGDPSSVTSGMISNFNDENKPSNNIKEVVAGQYNNNKTQNSSYELNSPDNTHNSKMESIDQFRNIDDVSAKDLTIEQIQRNNSDDSVLADSVAIKGMLYRNVPPLPILGYYSSYPGNNLYLQNNLPKTPIRQSDLGMQIDLLNTGTTFLGTGNGIPVPVYQLSYRKGKSGNINAQKVEVEGKLLHQDGNILSNNANVGFQDQNYNNLKLWPSGNIQNYDQDGAQFGYVSVPFDPVYQTSLQSYARVLRSLAETNINDEQQISTQTLQEQLS